MVGLNITPFDSNFIHPEQEGTVVVPAEEEFEDHREPRVEARADAPSVAVSPNGNHEEEKESEIIDAKRERESVCWQRTSSRLVLLP